MIKTNIIYKNIDELIPYENNPRVNENAVDYVAKSIEEFGFKVPMIIDNNNVIVAGHTRYKASLKLGIKEVPCIVADDLTDEQIKAFRLADNKVSEKSIWDIDMLQEELDNIDLDMQEFGFENLDIEWAKIDDLTEENYEEPQHKMLECPKCHHIDRDIHFKKVAQEE